LQGTLEPRGEEALKVAEAISSVTRFKMLRLLSREKLDISTIANKLHVSEAYVSEEIVLLEKVGIVRTTYQKGKRGVRKVCDLAVRRIVINIA